MNIMNKQEIFTKAKNHLLTQMCRSRAGGSCRYRGTNGLMCAVGCLIPDELYDPEMEGKPYTPSFTEQFPEVGKLFDGGTIEFMRRLQRLHDYAYYPEDWESALRQLAVEENLEF